MSSSSTPPNPIQLWTPPLQWLSSSHMTLFSNFVASRHPNTVGSTVSFDSHRTPLTAYKNLYHYSIQYVSDFWQDVAEYIGLHWIIPPSTTSLNTYPIIIDEHARMDSFPEWFPGTRLNFAQHMLYGCGRYTPLDMNSIAIISTTEQLTYQYVTRAQLIERVRIMASAMVAVGISIGDRVGGYIANCTDAIVAMLAAASIGAIWSSTSPDFGVTGVLDRFSQIQPKILFSINAVTYNGRIHNHLDKLNQVIQGLGNSIDKVIVIPHITTYSMDLTSLGPKAISLNEFIQLGDPNRTLIFTPLPFKHPLYILFSSGTTGKPKCIVHSAGGTLIQHVKEHLIHGNLGPKDIFLQYTTTGWMMWNWSISALVLGTTMVLYDGSPFKPTNDILWRIIHELKVTVFGTSAKYIQSMQHELNLNMNQYDITLLHSIYSTGSPLPSDSYLYVYQSIKSNILLGSITGGTDIISLFAGHNTNLPVYSGEIQCPCLGMAIQAYNIDKQGPVLGNIPGDLVCIKSFPCMPIYFWSDPNMERYKSTYFNDFPKLGIWSHGDFIYINPDTMGIIMLGRSDGTLNPSGVRFGSAELYNIIEQFPQIADSLVVAQKIGNDERVIMFIQMPDNKSLDTNLIEEINLKIRSQLSPRHVPAVIVQVPDIPYTINGKKVEVAVKRIISGQTVIPSGTLRNPESLQVFYNIPELKQ